MPALPHRELVEEPHVVNENVEEPDLVREPGGDVQTRRVDGHAEDILAKPLKCRWCKTSAVKRSVGFTITEKVCDAIIIRDRWLLRH